jgi:hypothetical protein
MAVTNKKELQEAIRLQELKVATSKEVLIDQYLTTKENLRPVNLVKNTFSQMTGNSELGKKLLQAGLGIGAAFVTKRLIAGPATSLAGRALTVAMNLGLAKAIAKPLKNKGIQLLKKFRHSLNGKSHTK